MRAIAFFRHGSLAQRLVGWFMLMLLVPTLLLALITDHLSSRSQLEKIQEQLSVIAKAKAMRLETYAYERTRAAAVLGRLRRLSSATLALQQAAGDTLPLDRIAIQDELSKLLYYFVENLGFTEAMLLSPRGDVLFQTQSALPLGDNLLEGPQRDTELAKSVQRAMTLLEPNLSDFALYPGVDTPLGFVSTPVIDEAGKVVGMLALQLNTREVFAPFTDYNGLGRSGHTVAVKLQGEEIRVVAPFRNHPDAAFNLGVPMGGDCGTGLQKAVQGELGAGETSNILCAPALSAWTYVPSFRWGIVVQQERDEAMAPVYRQRSAILTLLAMILAPVVLIALFVARGLSRPIRQAVAVAERVATGDLTVALDQHGDDEIGKLLQALERMVGHLHGLIGQVQKSTIELVSTSNTLTAMARVQGDEVSSLGATTNQIAAASKEISATSEELLATMGNVTEIAGHTTELAADGQSALHDMEQAMHHLADATQSISGKLGVIDDKANNINSVTTTIAKIADQTNLLSLNASIEAEKAGEYGLGFAVLAREIRRLADQTAVATLDIEQMVKEMQGAVAGGVMEMDRFSEQVRLGVAETQHIGAQFAEIIGQVQTLAPRFEAVHEGMRSQSAGARQIRDAMVSLTESARASIQSLEKTSSATQQLESAIAQLRQGVSLFKLSQGSGS